MNGKGGILGPDGRPVSAERVKIEKQTRFNPLRSWTPDVLTRQLEAWARGELGELAWVMEWIERHDDICQAVAPKAKAAVSRHGWEVMLREEISEADRGLAEEQKDALNGFYQRVEAGHAVEADERGGMRLLIQQVMDGYGKGYSAHHVVWKPDSARGLGAELVHVPLWFFEAKTGRLRFLENQWSLDGVDLDGMGGPGAWMISRGRGVMVACAIARMFKMIPLQDWLTYCDRHGMPGFIGKTTAKKGESGWEQMAGAVSSMGAEFGAVIKEGDSIEVLDLTASGQIPYPDLIDRMDRATVMLWRGGDLSTISRGGGSVGSNPQLEEQDDLDADNAAWVAETLDRQLSRQVLDYYFGPESPALAYLALRTKTRDDVRLDLAVVKAAREAGIELSRKWFVRKFGLVEADPEDEGDAMVEETGDKKPETRDQRSEARDKKPETRGKTAANADLGGDARGLLRNGIAAAAGVRARELAPIEPLLGDLARAAEDDELTGAEWLAFVEDAALSLPEFFDPALADDLARDMEDALGMAVVRGAREGLRDQKPETRDKTGDRRQDRATITTI